MSWFCNVLVLLSEIRLPTDISCGIEFSNSLHEHFGRVHASSVAAIQRALRAYTHRDQKAVRIVGNQLGRQILRGVLGGLMGGKR